MVYIPVEAYVETAKLFKNGRSQAVRLPKEFRIEDDEVFINKIGDLVMLIPKNKRWKILEESLSLFSEDFMMEREQPEIEEREGF